MTGPVSANDTIAAILLKRPEAARVLVRHRMHCVGCAIAPFETLAEACAIYGIALERLLGELDAAPTLDDEETHDD